MKRIRYNTISSLPHVMKFEKVDILLHQKFTESLSDVSYFVPTSESVRNLKAGDAVPNQFYDFPDGKDTGLVLPKARDRRSDIAEISSEIKYKTSVIRDGLNDYEKVKKLASAMDKKFNDTSDSSVSSGSSVN